MDSTDGQVPGPRRAVRPSSAPAAEPTGSSPLATTHVDVARVPELAALLADIGALRTTLQTDLSLAAAALEAGATDLAGELVDGDRTELSAFSERARGHLAALDADARTTPASAGVLAADTPAVAALPRPHRRSRMLQAAPLLAAAAALLGFAAGVVPDRAGTQQPLTTLTSAAQASDELSRLASLGASDETLRRAAVDLNAELSALVAEAAGDPAAAQQALALLDSTDDVLRRSDDTGLLRGVLAEARALRARLTGALTAVTAPVGPLVPTEAPQVTLRERREAEPQNPSPSGSASRGGTDPAPAPAASPAPQPTPEPRPEPAPPAEPAPTSEPAPAPAPAPEPSGEPSDPSILQPGFGV